MTPLVSDSRVLAHGTMSWTDISGGMVNMLGGTVSALASLEKKPKQKGGALDGWKKCK